MRKMYLANHCEKWSVRGCILLMMVLVGCAAKGAMQETPADAPMVGQVGNIILVERTTQVGGDKVIVATYLFRAGRVESREAMVAFGSGKLPRTEASDFRLILVDHQGNALAQYGIWDPRKVVVEKKGLVEIPEATYSARFPFNARAKEIRVLDSQGNVVATTEIGSLIREFCAKLKHDKDCTFKNSTIR